MSNRAGASGETGSRSPSAAISSWSLAFERTVSGSWSPTSIGTTTTFLSAPTRIASGSSRRPRDSGSVAVVLVVGCVSVSPAIVLPVPLSRRDRVSTMAAARVESPSRTSMMISSRRAATARGYEGCGHEGCRCEWRNPGCGRPEAPN